MPNNDMVLALIALPIVVPVLLVVLFMFGNAVASDPLVQPAQQAQVQQIVSSGQSSIELFDPIHLLEILGIVVGAIVGIFGGIFAMMKRSSG